MPVLTRLIPSPVVVDIRGGALADLARLLADQRISASGKLAFAVSDGSGARLRERLAPELPGADWFPVAGGTIDAAVELADAMHGKRYDAVVGARRRQDHRRAEVRRRPGRPAAGRGRHQPLARRHLLAGRDARQRQRARLLRRAAARSRWSSTST